MARRIDLTGQKFGRLTVISYNEEVSKQKRRAYWNCKCDCGNEKVICGSSLTTGHTTSCGCYSREKMKMLNEEKWQDEEYRQIKSNEMSKMLKEKWKDEEYRQMQSELSSRRFRERWQNEEFRRAQSERLKEQWQNEEFRQMQSEQRRRMNEEQWQNEEFRQKQSNRMSKMLKEKWQNEEYRQMQSSKLKERWQDEEFRQMRIDKTKEQWKDEEFRQKQSEIRSKMVGENHPRWKGGITPISKHLKDLPVVKQWFSDSKQQASYTCELTGKAGGVNTHHLKAFSTIVLEAHKLHNIQIHEIIGEYTQEELRKLEEYITSWHKDTSNAVVLNEDVHMLFHSLCGFGNNTPEQYEEFKQRYLKGEFEGLI